MGTKWNVNNDGLRTIKSGIGLQGVYQRRGVIRLVDTRSYRGTDTEAELDGEGNVIGGGAVDWEGSLSTGHTEGIGVQQKLTGCEIKARFYTIGRATRDFDNLTNAEIGDIAYAWLEKMIWDEVEAEYVPEVVPETVLEFEGGTKAGEEFVYKLSPEFDLGDDMIYRNKDGTKAGATEGYYVVVIHKGLLVYGVRK